MSGDVEYTPEVSGSGQFGICCKCKLPPTVEGHDGCLGTLKDPLIMNTCCGHGSIEHAYIQYWNGSRIDGQDAIGEQANLIATRYQLYFG